MVTKAMMQLRCDSQLADSRRLCRGTLPFFFAGSRRTNGSAFATPRGRPPTDVLRRAHRATGATGVVLLPQGSRVSGSLAAPGRWHRCCSTVSRLRSVRWSAPPAGGEGKVMSRWIRLFLALSTQTIVSLAWAPPAQAQVAQLRLDELQGRVVIIERSNGTWLLVRILRVGQQRVTVELEDGYRATVRVSTIARVRTALPHRYRGPFPHETAERKPTPATPHRFRAEWIGVRPAVIIHGVATLQILASVGCPAGEQGHYGEAPPKSADHREQPACPTHAAGVAELSRAPPAVQLQQ